MENAENIYSYGGKILRVNLSNGEIYTVPTAKYAKDWIGGPGIAIKILYDELRSWVPCLLRLHRRDLPRRSSTRRRIRPAAPRDIQR